tara:strand:- start:13258 stop:14376 length:1119 start_codon:yes stop_codon:yes gene_type:complete
LIIGGGIMGTSAAFFLRQRGRSVRLLESGLIGRQASGTTFGNIRRQGRPLDQLPISNRAIDIWRNSKQLLGEDVEYVEGGHMRVCYKDRPEYVEIFEKYAKDAAETGLDLEILNSNELRSRFPFLGPDCLAGSYSANCGHANPRLASPAFARAAQREGALIHEQTRVVEVEKENEDFRVTAVDGRVFKAPILLITAGAWGDILSKQFGEPVPLIARAPTMSVTEPVPYQILPTIGVATPLEEETVYFRQVTRGNVIIGGSTRAPAYRDVERAYVEPENILSQLREIRKFAPPLAKLNIIRVWSGIEGYLPDSQPLMGLSSKVSGLHYAFGFSGSGFQIGPAVGDIMAELIDTGATDIDLSNYDMKRFQKTGI